MLRKVNVYLAREDRHFKLTVVQVEKKNTYEGNIDPLVFAILDMHNRSINDYIAGQYMRFNQINNREQDDKSFRPYLISHQHETVTDQYHRNSQYIFESITWKLPLDSTKLLQFLGALDPAMHTFELILDEDERLKTNVQLCDGSPNLTNLVIFCRTTMSAPLPPVAEKEWRLSRHIVSWMQAELASMVESDKELTTLLTLLNDLLSTETVSLTPAIRGHLYPSAPISTLIEQYHSDADPLMKKLLDPQYPHTATTSELITFIKSMLAKKMNKSEINTEDQDSIEAAKTNAALIHTEIKDWFIRLGTFRENLWRNNIESRLFGKAANDGGFYSDTYTEIALLKQARFTTNSSGLVELHYLDTDAYHKYYAPGRRLHELLEVELRQSCADLDLAFLPNQDFHQRAVFNAESSKLLKDHGFHYSEAFCKTHLRNEMLMRQFKFSANPGAHNPFNSMPADLQKLMLTFIADAYEQADDKQLEVAESAIRLTM